MCKVLKNNYLALKVLIQIAKHTEDFIYQNQLNRWNKLISLNPEDKLLKDKIIDSMRKPGFPDF